MADAINGLVSDAQPKDEKAGEDTAVEPPASTSTEVPATVVTPTPADTTPEAPEDEQSSSGDDGSTVAHKKIIKPITDGSVAPQSDLSELLAREGITGMEDENSQPASAPAQNAAPPAPLPPAPTGLPTTPHPPGHVISPNPGQSSVDPNSISL
jgi:hypothetical protein